MIPPAIPPIIPPIVDPFFLIALRALLIPLLMAFPIDLNAFLRDHNYL